MSASPTVADSTIAYEYKECVQIVLCRSYQLLIGLCDDFRNLGPSALRIGSLRVSFDRICFTFQSFI